MSGNFVDSPADPADGLLQVIAAILLGLAATFTAVSAYQAALLDGEALHGYTTSTRTLSDANAFYAQGNQTTAMDQQLFIAYATAQNQGDSELAEYLTTLMRPELKAGIAWWKKSDTRLPPLDPSVQENPYEVADFNEASDLEEEAGKLFDAAARADNKGDKFQLSTVLFALTLFFGGISTVFRRRSVSRALLGVSGVTLLAGTAQLVTAFFA
jgi:hypothetical protein